MMARQDFFIEQERRITISGAVVVLSAGYFAVRFLEWIWAGLPVTRIYGHIPDSEQT